jgi:hypothetical protein
MVMSVSLHELAATYPYLYHVTSEGSWPSIQRYGLLSTQALLDLFAVDEALRERLIATRRPDCVTITHPQHGQAVIRDQKPLIESRLRSVLQDGMTPREWYTLLNGKTFFWVTESRFETLRNARAYDGLRQTLIIVDCARLLERHSDRITLCPMNSGAARPMAFPRGRRTFLPISEYPFDERRRKRGKKNAVVELSVEYSVPDIRDLAISVSEIGGGKPEQKIWPLAPKSRPLQK